MGTLELYDLSRDLGETQNIASRNPERTRFLVKFLSEHLRETKDLIPILRETGKTVSYPSGIPSL